MRALFLRKLFLYPRFQASVKDALERSQVGSLATRCQHSTLLAAVLYFFLSFTYICYF